MEISFVSREIPVFREFFHQSRRIQESLECVVPDTEADIEKIAAVQSSVFLKSKDLTGRGVLISGEISASVLYIPEGQTDVCSLRLRKPFSVEYEAEGLESETLTQVSLFLQATDVRIMNPRKISLLCEIEAELSGYRRESLCMETELPENVTGLHAQIEEHALVLPNAVCEKSVSINEQFCFPTGAPLPASLASERAELLISDCQLIGSKIIVKGSAEISVCALSEGGEPCLYSFSAPFSQIVEAGTESMSHCAVRPEITGAYYDTIDTVSGEKALDVELHAVLQLVCSERQTVRCITDAYSNLMPTELVCRTQEYELLTAEKKLTLSKDERIGLTESCREFLCVFTSVARISADADRIGAAVNLDFLYRCGDGRLSASRRTVTISQDLSGTAPRILHVYLSRFSARPDGEYADCSVALELSCLSCEKAEMQSVGGVILDEDLAYVQESLPTLTLVRPEGESVWSLAKKYHSSTEKIRELNEARENSAKLMMIPKCI